MDKQIGPAEEHILWGRAGRVKLPRAVQEWRRAGIRMGSSDRASEAPTTPTLVGHSKPRMTAPRYPRANTTTRADVSSRPMAHFSNTQMAAVGASTVILLYITIDGALLGWGRNRLFCAPRFMFMFVLQAQQLLFLACMTIDNHYMQTSVWLLVRASHSSHYCEALALEHQGFNSESDADASGGAGSGVLQEPVQRLQQLALAP